MRDRLGEPFCLGKMMLATFDFEYTDEFSHLVTLVLILMEKDRADQVTADIEEHAPEQ